MIDKECIKCGFYDEDFECTCPHADKWYACPLEPEPKAKDFTREEEEEGGDADAANNK